MHEFYVFLPKGRAVQMARSLEEGHRKILVPDTTDVVFEENNGKLVLLAGKHSLPYLSVSQFLLRVFFIHLNKIQALSKLRTLSKTLCMKFPLEQ